MINSNISISINQTKWYHHIHKRHWKINECRIRKRDWVTTNFTLIISLWIQSTYHYKIHALTISNDFIRYSCYHLMWTAHQFNYYNNHVKSTRWPYQMTSSGTVVIIWCEQRVNSIITITMWNPRADYVKWRHQVLLLSFDVNGASIQLLQ
jgi:hypothetical protein